MNIYKIANKSSSTVDTHLLVIVHGLSDRVRLVNSSGITKIGDPYLRVFLPDGVLRAGQSVTEKLVFQGKANDPQVSYTLDFLSGQGKP